MISVLAVLNKDGKRDSLRFPQFRSEMLSQNFWNAGENIGRIKIVISEGILPALTALPFKRMKNLVSFSFQHAPLSNSTLVRFKISFAD